ncbi:MAG TPA: response regulator [Planctomycetota bacterium]|nr:response regulator [Planctomycetota bacterium]
MRATTSILVADQESDSRSRLLRALRREGYETVPASTGAEAVELAKSPLVRITILDVLLPDLSGIETFELISGFRDVQGIFLTRERTKETMVRLLDAGAFTVLDKPPRLDWLLAAVRLLDHRLESENEGRRDRAAPRNDGTKGAGGLPA